MVYLRGFGMGILNLLHVLGRGKRLSTGVWQKTHNMSEPMHSLRPAFNK